MQLDAGAAEVEDLPVESLTLYCMFNLGESRPKATGARPPINLRKYIRYLTLDPNRHSFVC